MPDAHSHKQIRLTYSQTRQALEEIGRKHFFKWIQKLDGEFHMKLEQPLLIRCKSTSSTLNINFDKWVSSNENLTKACVVTSVLGGFVYVWSVCFTSLNVLYSYL